MQKNAFVHPLSPLPSHFLPFPCMAIPSSPPIVLLISSLFPLSPYSSLSSYFIPPFFLKLLFPPTLSFFLANFLPFSFSLLFTPSFHSHFIPPFFEWLFDTNSLKKKGTVIPFLPFSAKVPHLLTKILACDSQAVSLKK